MAADEDYWREIQFAFTLDRTIINLNNGNSCPAPTVVHEACKRYNDWANQAPVYHRGMTERNIETTRRRLAAEFGADPEEIAITRNSSESLQIAQMGLDMKPGDEVLTTEQDYGRMLTTWDQRVRRDKIKLTKVDFPAPTNGEDLIGRLTRAITPQTKVMHFCHITNQSGQLFPVRQLRRHRPGPQHHHHRRRRPRRRPLPLQAERARHGLLRGVAAQVAARADGHRAALRAQRAHRLHLAAAGGAGHPRHRHPQVRGGRHPADRRQGGDQRGHRLPAGDRHRAQGRAPALPHAALGQRPAHREAIKIHSNLAEGETWGLACVSIDGVDSRKLVDHLWDKHRIVITSIGHDNPDDPTMSYRALRVTPNIYTPLEEVDTFVDAMRAVLKNGLSA